MQDEDYYSDEEDTYYNDDDYYKENVTESSLEPCQTSDNRIFRLRWVISMDIFAVNGLVCVNDYSQIV